jgi:hypothetical protein
MGKEPKLYGEQSPMTDENKPTQSYILVAFADVNSVANRIELVNVSPAQVLAAVSMLEVKAKNAYITQENERMEREAQMQIAKPSEKILVGR